MNEALVLSSVTSPGDGNEFSGRVRAHSTAVIEGDVEPADVSPISWMSANQTTDQIPETEDVGETRQMDGNSIGFSGFGSQIDATLNNIVGKIGVLQQRIQAVCRRDSNEPTDSGSHYAVEGESEDILCELPVEGLRRSGRLCRKPDRYNPDKW